jgi:hypothetical protein
VRHVLALGSEELKEGEWKLVAAGTVINPVFPGKRLANVTAKKAWAFPCFKTKPFQASKIL